MQPLQPRRDGRVSPDRCAREVLAGVPAVMRFIRSQMRRNRRAELSVPQFRALVFLSHADDCSLSAMAEHLGLSLPAASRMVDLLVRRGLLQRRDHARDRRRVALSLTPLGRRVFEDAFAATRMAMARRFRSCSAAQLARVARAMRLLNDVFAPHGPAVRGQPASRAPLTVAVGDAR